MTKKDIVMEVSSKTGIKQVEVKEIVQRTLDAIIGALSREDRVELRNFGVFSVKHRKGRKGRNPRTGEEVPVPPKTVPVFKPGLLMREKVEEIGKAEREEEEKEGEKEGEEDSSESGYSFS